MLLRYRQTLHHFTRNIEILTIRCSYNRIFRTISATSNRKVFIRCNDDTLTNSNETIRVRLIHSKPFSSPESKKTENDEIKSGSLSRSTKFTSTNDKSKRRTSFTERTHMCGELTSQDIGEKVTLSGWVQHFRMSGQFVILRDAIGSVQIVIPPSKSTLLQELGSLPLESVILVRGVVRGRPEGQANTNMATGEVEVVAEEVELLNECMANLPFQVHDHHTVKEPLRLRYRYLEMRGRRLQADLRFRSQLIQRMRHFLTQRHGFVDVETPTLFRRTPGGAREFIVPTRCGVRGQSGQRGETGPGQIGQRGETGLGQSGQRGESGRGSLKESKGQVGEDELDAIVDENGALFYSLPQSPQQFKQLLMVGAIDRYMQIARCYRDETSKPDRQPEFTQLDIEMSFTTQQQIMSLVEHLLAHCWPVIGSNNNGGGANASVNHPTLASESLKHSGEVTDSETASNRFASDWVNKNMGGGSENANPDTVTSDWMREEEAEFISQGQRLNLPPLKIPFPRMNYEEALRQYGCDKPDTRFDSRLVDVTQTLRKCGFEPISSSQSVQAVVFSPEDMATLSRGDLEELGRSVRTFSQRNGNTAVKFVAVCKVKSDRGWTGGLEKRLEGSAVEELTRLLQLSPGCVFAVVAGERVECCLTAGRFRTETREKTHPDGLTDPCASSEPRQMNFLWVEKFPLFLHSDLEDPASSKSPRWESAHHPFTAAHPEDLELLRTDPGRARSQHYDLVLNGTEVGGGSIRIHDAELQRYVLRDILREDDEQLRHLLNALKSGCPPHGGIALGLDRLIALLCGCNSVREVIAFPKASDGRCLMSGAPAVVSREDLEYYGIKVNK